MKDACCVVLIVILSVIGIVTVAAQDKPEPQQPATVEAPATAGSVQAQASRISALEQQIRQQQTTIQNLTARVPTPPPSKEQAKTARAALWNRCVAIGGWLKEVEIDAATGSVKTFRCAY